MFKSKLNKLDDLIYKAIKNITVDSYIIFSRDVIVETIFMLKKSKPQIKKLKKYLE